MEFNNEIKDADLGLRGFPPSAVFPSKTIHSRFMLCHQIFTRKTGMQFNSPRRSILHFSWIPSDSALEIWNRDDDQIANERSAVKTQLHRDSRMLPRASEAIAQSHKLAILIKHQHEPLQRVRGREKFIEELTSTATPNWVEHDVHYSTKRAFLHKLSNNRPSRPFVCTKKKVPGTKHTAESTRRAIARVNGM